MNKKMLIVVEKISLSNERRHLVMQIHDFFCEKYPSNFAENIFHSSSKLSEVFFNIKNLYHYGSGKNSNQCHGKNLKCTSL